MRAAPVLLLAAVLSLLAASTSYAAPKVVATIKPIHSLTAAVMRGVAEPKLLLDGAASPHAYALKPSDARAVEEADLVIRVSPHLEVFLDRALASLPANARVIDLDHAPGLDLLAVRPTPGAPFAPAKMPDDVDVHFWLDPVNAITLAREIARQLSAIDGENAARYAANAAELEAKLTALDGELKEQFGGLSDRPFVVFHDVTQYLERRYKLKSLGAVVLSPERSPGAGSLASLRDQIRSGGAVCIFYEPQFSPRLIDMLIEGRGVKRGSFDEIGARVPAGPDQYFGMMRLNAGNVAACLKP